MVECPRCPRRLQDSETLESHLETHDSDDSLVCDECECVYATQRTFRIHYKKSHGESLVFEEYDCASCGSTVGYYSSEDDRTGELCRSCYTESLSGPTVTIECEWCGDENEYAEYQTGRRFCSQDCHYEWRKAELDPEDHPNWKGGRSQYRGSDWAEQRRKALDRDRYQCQVCEDEDQLVVHHIVSFHDFDVAAEANKLSNLVTLCRSCHGYLEGWIAREGLDPQSQRRALSIALSS